MKRVISMAAAVALVSGLAVFGPAPAEAVTTVRECVTTGTAEFRDALGTDPHDGDIYWWMWADCPQQSANGSSGVVSGWYFVHLKYSGSCQTARIWSDSGHDGLLVGGTEMVLTAPSPGETAAGSFTFISSDPCNQSYATTVGVSAGVRL